MNKSLICLIPKQHQPEFISQFRPICLSNVIFKVVTKVIANCLKILMGDLVGDWQASFIPGRQMTDNIIVAQELAHSMRTRRRKHGEMIVKIDLEKAYDRIDWRFLEAILEQVDFETMLRKVIKNCISSSTLSILWNGECLDEFRPERGLRQGDPLSPYLFVLCMETLAHKINMATTQKQWKAVKASQGGTPISHLFFADDLL